MTIRLRTTFHLTPSIGLWAAVVAGAVLGRIIDPGTPDPYETEVFSSHPEIERQQIETWGREFFQVPSYQRTIRPSRTEILEEIPRHFPRSYSQFNHDRVNGNRRYYEVNQVRLESVKPVVKSENLEWMLNNVFTYPRNHNTNETAKEAAKKYIVDSLQVTSGLETAVQHFQPIQFLNIYDGSTVPMGTNIIGVLKGREWGTPNDRPLLLGAHYDTVTFSPGTDDNGSGVASMLETARALTQSGCVPKYSIFFVAFDLEEVGSQGSLIFIKDYLTQVLKKGSAHEIPLSRFQGAFIMDTIMNFNDTEGSQTFPTDWSLLLPRVYDEVADNHYKGDFLSMIYRREIDNHLAEKFIDQWLKLTSDKFHIQPFPLNLGKDLPSMNLLADHLNFLRSDHSRFWYMNDTTVPISLNAVLMTDTGPYRGNMRSCYHTVCDGPEVVLTQDNLQFLTKITQALTNTLMGMSECEKSPPEGGSQPQNFIRTSQVYAKSSSDRGTSPLRHLLNFVKWMEVASSF